MLDFPTPTSIGQVYTGTNGVTYIWNGTLWLASGASAGGDFCANQTSSFQQLTSTVTTLILTQVTSGNSGGWYNTSTGRYTPPAGRYFISAGFSSSTTAGAASMVIYIRKNGVSIIQVNETFGAASQFAAPAAETIVDANGSDWFDIQGQCGSGGTQGTLSMWFLAYPITGIKGPPGDPGTALAQNAQAGSYTLVLGDANGHLYHAVAAAAATWTIPDNATVAYPIGTTLTFVNDSTNNVTIAITTDTMVLSPGTTTGSRTLAQGGVATALKATATRWVINGSGLT